MALALLASLAGRLATLGSLIQAIRGVILLVPPVAFLVRRLEPATRSDHVGY